MSTAIPLPPPGNMFDEDEETRNAYARLLPLGDQREVAIRILGQMLIQAPTLNGRRRVAKCINQCETSQEVVELGEFHLGYFTKYFKALRTASAPPPLSFGELQLDLPVEAPITHAEAKKQGLMRDNYRCMLSGAVDDDAVESLPWLYAEVVANHAKVADTRCSLIVPEHIACEDIAGSINTSTSNIQTIPRLFGIANDFCPNQPAIFDLRNILTLEVGVQVCFKKFVIWLEPTGAVDNQYYIVRKEDYHYRDLPGVVTLSSTSPDLPLPDPKYLAFHAACARILKFSGASDFIISFLDEVEDTHVLSGDGSSGELLNHLLRAESLAVS
ncbi:unnamed protein product [Rhizoctonia solani]|uniref:HNH nuclease domain-containing protein n=1 Tax=Rhizoctonia solani TaxID=456999 RepID=A0A8H3AXB1_9AGAM|nr:unnamed protein product [Rhizoctonia solani]